MLTLGEITEAHGFTVLEHLEADLEVPALEGLQAQGDLFIVPAESRDLKGFPGQAGGEVPAAGIAVIAAVGAGHEHRLFAGTPGTAACEAPACEAPACGAPACGVPAVGAAAGVTES